VADDRVTVIPVSNEALQAVETPYVAFEHPFKDRPGRLTRQADALDLDSAMAAYAVGDVWPMGQLRPYSTKRMRNFISGFEHFRPIFSTHLWPEAMLYKTSVLQNCALNEKIIYRPAVEPWTRLKRNLGASMVERTLFMPEPMIEVEDRLRYSHVFAGVPPVLPAVQSPVSVLIVLDGKIPFQQAVTDVFAQTISDFQVLVADCDGRAAMFAGIDDPRWLLLDTPGLTRAAALNLLLERAHGERIALWDPSCTYERDRLERQLAFDADFVGGPVAATAGFEEHDPIPFGHTNFSGLSYVPQETMLISRRVFERLGAFDPYLSVQYGLDLQLRAFGDTELTLARQRDAMARRIQDADCSERAVYGLYALFVKRDLAIAHFGRDSAHQWISFEDKRR
jgi:hypothetical protein